MITNISLLTVWVSDLDEAHAFYIDKLGFEPGDDVSFGDFRWLTVRHPKQPELEVHLSTPGPPLSNELAGAIRRSLAAGQMPGFGIATDDCRATFAELSAKGVEFIQEPQDRPYGVEALLRDNSGNWLVLVEQRPFDPSMPMPG